MAERKRIRKKNTEADERRRKARMKKYDCEAPGCNRQRTTSAMRAIDPAPGATKLILLCSGCANEASKYGHNIVLMQEALKKARDVAIMENEIAAERADFFRSLGDSSET